MKNDTIKEMNERWLKGYSKRQAHLMGSAQVCTNFYNKENC